MRVLQINTFYLYGSTGRIVYDLMKVQEKDNIASFVAYGTDTLANKGEIDSKRIIRLQGYYRRKINILRTRLFDYHGFYNEFETEKLLKWLDDIHPDIIHLHNIHNHYVHVGMLFEYIKVNKIPVVWTLHDCWAFTGHCAHFDYEKCEKWKDLCHNCTLLKEYPPTWFFDRSSDNFNLKKKAFTGVDILTLVTPSRWLADLTRESFLSEYPVVVINNGVDTTTFKKTESSNLQEGLNVSDKKIILAMASGFGLRKGGLFLKKLPELLAEDELLILVGSGAKKQARIHPKKCIGIEYTNNIQELVEYYSLADVFINPTLEDNFPTTNIEAMSCGTPVVTFNTGGSVESVLDGEEIYEENGIEYTSVGAVVPKGNLELLLKASRKIIKKGKEAYSSACRKKAIDKYNKDKQYEKYINLYKQILK